MNVSNNKTQMQRHDSYFQYPNLYLVILISFGMWLLTMSRFYPDGLPAYFGIISEFGYYMGKTYPMLVHYIFLGAWGVHGIESYFAWILCRRKRLNTQTTVKWCMQTFLIGFPSLLKLSEYRPNLRSSKAE